MVNPETLQNHIKNVHHKNGQTKAQNNRSSELTQNEKLNLLAKSHEITQNCTVNFQFPSLLEMVEVFDCRNR